MKTVLQELISELEEMQKTCKTVHEIVFFDAVLSIIESEYIEKEKISTTNAQIEGWSIFGQGSKDECEKIQLNDPAFQGTDIYADTLNKNSRIVSKTEAKRKYKLDI